MAPWLAAPWQLPGVSLVSPWLISLASPPLVQVYLRFEAAINQLLLPVTRQRNRFCRDFREVLARAQGLDGESLERLMAAIDQAVAGVGWWSAWEGWVATWLWDGEASLRVKLRKLRKGELEIL